MNRVLKLGYAGLSLGLSLGLIPLTLTLPSVAHADTDQRVARSYPWSSDRLVLEVPADVEFHPGARWQLTIRAPERTLDQLVVENGRIEAKPHACFSLVPLCIGYGTQLDDTVQVELTGPALRDIKVDGAAQIDLDGMHQNRLALKIDGSAKVRGTGSVGDLVVAIDGAGRIDLGQMTENDAHIGIAGSGTVDIAPTQSVTVRIDGAGEVRLHSDPPQVISHIDGAGEVIRVPAG